MRVLQAMVSEVELFDGLAVERDSGVIQGKLKNGEPLLDWGALRIKSAAAQRVFELLVNVFREHLIEKNEDWEKLKRGAHGGDIVAREMLEATLQHRWGDLQAWARRLSIDIDSLQFFSLYLARPFRQHAARRLWDGAEADSWQEGHCPICGHSPVLGRLIGASGPRRLWCCCCNTSWSFSRIGCPFCENRDQDQLGYLTVNEFASYRIYVCDKCRRYLKTRVCAEESDKDDWDYDRDFLATIALDSIALREGYVADPVWLAHGEQPSAVP